MALENQRREIFFLRRDLSRVLEAVRRLEYELARPRLIRTDDNTGKGLEQEPRLDDQVVKGRGWRFSLAFFFFFSGTRSTMDEPVENEGNGSLGTRFKVRTLTISDPTEFAYQGRPLFR